MSTMVESTSKGQIEHIFPTPIYWQVLKDCDSLNADLRSLILEKEQTTPSTMKSNMGGWQSAPTFFYWEEQAVKTLEGHVRSALDAATVQVAAPRHLQAEYDLYGWGAVNRRGHYNSVHLHPMATWSGVYYVDPGDEPAGEAGAVLEFAHPITASTMTFFPGILPSARAVRPEAGMMIVFPSYLLHSVRLYSGDRPRICIPFNAHLKELVPRKD